MLDNNYYTVKQYVESKCGLRDRIKALDLVILNLEMSGLSNVGQNSDLSDYEFNDGQMRIKVTYRSGSDVARDILALEQMKQRYIARLNGRKTGLRGGNIYY